MAYGALAINERVFRLFARAMVAHTLPLVCRAASADFAAGKLSADAAAMARRASLQAAAAVAAAWQPTICSLTSSDYRGSQADPTQRQMLPGEWPAAAVAAAAKSAAAADEGWGVGLVAESALDSAARGPQKQLRPVSVRLHEHPGGRTLRFPQSL